MHQPYRDDIRAVIFATIVGLALSGASVSARAQVVGVRHPTSGSAAQREWYREHRDDRNVKRSGAMDRLDVPNGGEVCVELVEPNTLLYQYSLSAKEEVTATPSSYTTFLTQLAGLIGPGGAAAAAAPRVFGILPMASPLRGARARVADLETYVAKVSALAVELPKQAATFIASTDGGPPGALRNFAEVLDSLGRITAKMDDAATEAAASRDKAKVQATDATLFSALVALEGIGNANLAKLKEEAQKARDAANKPVCRVVKDKPMRLYLSAKPLSSDAKLRRPVGDSIHAFSADPRVTDRTSVGVGGFIVPWVSGRKAFESDKAGVVRETKNQPLDPQVATFLQVRSGTSPFWLSVGVGTGPGKQPSYVLGAMWRPQDIVGARMDASLGVGMVYQTGTIVGLTDSAQLDTALPVGKTVSDVVQRSKRIGVGVMLSVSGLDLESLIPKP